MKTKNITKRTHTYGKPVYKKTLSTIIECACGNKYIKTRKNQDACLRCFNRPQ